MLAAMRRGAWLGVVGVWTIAAGWLVACSSDDSQPATTTLLDGSVTKPSEKPLGDASNGGGDAFVSADAGGDANTTADAGQDASPSDGGSQDADADAALPVLKRFTGNINFNGPFAGAKVELLAPTTDSVVTDATGDFFFYAPVGSIAVVKATPPADAGAYPMIRGIVVEESERIRVFYLQAKSDLEGLPALGLTLDDTKAIVEVDFRNAQIGGYGATFKDANGATVTPGFGIASGENGFEESLVTLRGGDGSTMFYGNVPAGDVSFTAIVPTDAGAPVIPCDAPKLPLEPGVVTWFDFEAGNANCQ